MNVVIGTNMLRGNSKWVVDYDEYKHMVPQSIEMKGCLRTDVRLISEGDVCTSCFAGPRVFRYALPNSFAEASSFSE